METVNFDPKEYFLLLAKQNRLCRKHAFKPLFCAGPETVQGIIDDFRDTGCFVLISDTTDNNVHYSRPGWFTRSLYTVWILAQFDFGAQDQYKSQLQLCREIFRQFLSRMVSDKAKMRYGQAMTYLNLDNVLYKELGRYSYNGATGLYFMVENDVPTSLVLNPDEWTEE